MTVTTETNAVSYSGDGIQLEFPYLFKIIEAEDMRVYINDIPIAPDDAVYPYVVKGAGEDSGGSVDFSGTPPPPGQDNVQLVRVVPATQEIDYTPYDDFPAETHERGLDKLTMLVQQALNNFELAVTIPPNELPLGLITELPPVADRAEQYLYVDADGNITTIRADIALPAVYRIIVGDESSNLMYVNTSDISPSFPVIGFNNINQPNGAVQLNAQGKIPAELVEILGLRNRGYFRGDDLCDKPGDTTGDCTAPDTRNPSQRFPEQIPTFRGGDYYVLSFEDPETSGTMDLYADIGDATSQILTVEPNDGILYAEEVEDPANPGTILVQAGWYIVRNMVSIGDAISISFDDTGLTYLQGANVQVALQYLDSHLRNERDGWYQQNRDINRTAYNLPATTDPQNDINAIQASGIYVTNSNTVGSPDATKNFMVTHRQQGAGNTLNGATQVAQALDSTLVYARTFVEGTPSGAWTDWGKIFPLEAADVGAPGGSWSFDGTTLAITIP